VTIKADDSLFLSLVINLITMEAVETTKIPVSHSVGLLVCGAGERLGSYAMRLRPMPSMEGLCSGKTPGRTALAAV
jgi:hypothetical protein